MPKMPLIYMMGKKALYGLVGVIPSLFKSNSSCWIYAKLSILSLKIECTCGKLSFSIFRLSEDLVSSMLKIEFVSSNVDCSWNISDSTLSLLTSPFGLVLKDFFACLVLSIIGLVIF